MVGDDDGKVVRMFSSLADMLWKSCLIHTSTQDKIDMNGFYMTDEDVDITPKHELIKLFKQLNLTYRDKQKVFKIETLRKNAKKYFSKVKKPVQEGDFSTEDFSTTAPPAESAAPAAAASAISNVDDGYVWEFVKDAIRDWLEDSPGGTWPPRMNTLYDSNGSRQHLWSYVDEDMFTDIRDSFLCDETNDQDLEKLTNIGDYLVDKKGDVHDGKKSADE